MGRKTGRIKVKGSAKEHICIIHRHRHQCDDGQREGGKGWVDVGIVREIGTSVIMSTIQIKKSLLTTL